MSEHPEPSDLDVEIPVPSGLKVAVEDHPYRILLVADFCGSNAGTVSGPMAEQVVDVTAESLPDIIRTARPSLHLVMKDPLAPGGPMAEVDLTFDSYKAFDPLNLAQQIPDTRALLAARSQIVERMRGRLTEDALHKDVTSLISTEARLGWLAEALSRPPAPSVDADAVDDILGAIDLGGEPPPSPEGAPKTPVGKLVSATASDGSSIPASEASVLRRALAEIDRRVSAWLTAVLHAPPVQAIECAWRSLNFLVAHLEFRRGIRLSVLHADKNRCLERFRTRVIDAVFDQGMAAPNILIVDQAMTQSAPDVEALDELAQHATSLPAFAVVSAAPEFLGVKYAWQIATLPPIVAHVDQWQFAKWNSLRRQPYARAVGVVLGRGLLRVPHQAGSADDLSYHYREDCVSDKDLLWVGGAVVLACAVARSVVDSRWPTSFCGPFHGRVDGFTTCTGGPKGDKDFGPTDLHLPVERIAELGTVGINVVAGVRDVPEAVVWNGVTAAYASGTDNTALYEITLPYQLFAARAGQLLYELKTHLVGLQPEPVVALVYKHLMAWLPFEGEPSTEQLAVRARPSSTTPSAIELTVTLTPPPQILPGGVPVGLGYRIDPSGLV